MNSPEQKRKNAVLGIGLDNADGHKRITKGEGFTIVSGSEKTHEEMTEKAVKINEKLKKRGKTMENASYEEFDDAAHSVGLVRADEKLRQQQEQGRRN
jgi:hypothetical protein